MATKSLCSVDGCCKPARTRGWCSTHYSRWLLHGDPLALKCPPNGTLAKWITDHSDYDGDACLIWPFSRNPNGYACQIRVEGTAIYAHRYMCELVHGAAPEPDLDTAHSCGRGHDGCVNPQHLRWDTRAGNVADQIKHGTIARGNRKPNAKLTLQDIAAIRCLEGKQSQRAIAHRFGVSQQLISEIHSGKRYGWVSAAD